MPSFGFSSFSLSLQALSVADRQISFQQLRHAHIYWLLPFPRIGSLAGREFLGRYDGAGLLTPMKMPATFMTRAGELSQVGLPCARIWVDCR